MGGTRGPHGTQDSQQSMQGIIYAIQHTKEDISTRAGKAKTLLDLLWNHALRKGNVERSLHDLHSLFMKMNDLSRLCKTVTGRPWTIDEVWTAAKDLELPEVALARLSYNPKTFTAASLPGPPDRSMLRKDIVLSPEDAKHFGRSKIERLAPRNRSVFIVVLEVDAIKDMADEEEYTLSNDSRILIFLSSLIERYSLAKLEVDGTLRKYCAQSLFQATRDVWRVHQVGAPSKERPWKTFWRTGSKHIKSAWVEKTRHVTLELSAAQALPLYDATSAEWRFGKIQAWVESILSISNSNGSDSVSELEASAPPASPTTQSSEMVPVSDVASSVIASAEIPHLGQVRTTRFQGSYSEQRSKSRAPEITSRQDPMALTKTRSSTETTAEATITPVEHTRILTLSNPSEPVPASIFSFNTDSEDDSSTDGQSSEEVATSKLSDINRQKRGNRSIKPSTNACQSAQSSDFHADKIVAGVKDLRRHHRTVIQAFFDLIKLRPNDTSPDIPDAGLDELCIYIWGDEWHQVFQQLRDTYNLMPSLDTLVALSSAYLDHQVLSRTESASRVSVKDDYDVDSLLRRAALHTTTKPELTPPFIRNDAESLAKDLQSILEPYLQALINTAAAKRLLNPLTYIGFWEDTFYRQMAGVFEKAILLKLQMAASPHEYRTFWHRHGKPFAAETMTLAYPTKSEPRKLRVAYTVHCGLKVKYLVGDEEHEAIEVEAEIAAQRAMSLQA